MKIFKLLYNLLLFANTDNYVIKTSFNVSLNESLTYDKINLITNINSTLRNNLQIYIDNLDSIIFNTTADVAVINNNFINNTVINNNNIINNSNINGETDYNKNITDESNIDKINYIYVNKYINNYLNNRINKRPNIYIINKIYNNCTDNIIFDIYINHRRLTYEQVVTFVNYINLDILFDKYMKYICSYSLISINNVNNNYIITEGTDNEIDNVKKHNMYVILSIAIIVTLIVTIIMTLLIIKYCKKNKKVIGENRGNTGNTGNAGNTTVDRIEVENTSVEIKMDNEKYFQDINLE